MEGGWRHPGFWEGTDHQRLNCGGCENILRRELVWREEGKAAAKRWCWVEGKVLEGSSVHQLPVSPGSDPLPVPPPPRPDKLGLIGQCNSEKQSGREISSVAAIGRGTNQQVQ